MRKNIPEVGEGHRDAVVEVAAASRDLEHRELDAAPSCVRVVLRILIQLLHHGGHVINPEEPGHDALYVLSCVVRQHWRPTDSELSGYAGGKR
jgi:hypothetical protein